MAKPKRGKRNKHKQRSQKSSPPEANSSRLQTVSAWVGIIGFVVAIGMTGLSLLPKIGISEVSSLNPIDPFATPFVIRNDGYLSIQNVRFYCGLYELKPLKGLNLPTVRRHDKEDVRFTNPKSAIAEIRANESTTIFCDFGEPIRSIGLESGDIAIVVSYRPAFVFWRREHRQRFSTMKSPEGILYWRPYADSD